MREDLLVAVLFPRIQHDGRPYLGIVERIGVGGKAEARPALRLHGDVPDGQRSQTPQLVRTEGRPGDHRRAIRVERFLEHRTDCPLVGRGTGIEGVRLDACPMPRRPVGCLDIRRCGWTSAGFRRNKMQHQFFKESRIASGEDIACIWPRHCHESACPAPNSNWTILVEQPSGTTPCCRIKPQRRTDDVARRPTPASQRRLLRTHGHASASVIGRLNPGRLASPRRAASGAHQSRHVKSASSCGQCSADPARSRRQPASSWPAPCPARRAAERRSCSRWSARRPCAACDGHSARSPPAAHRRSRGRARGPVDLLVHLRLRPSACHVSISSSPSASRAAAPSEKQLAAMRQGLGHRRRRLPRSIPRAPDPGRPTVGLAEQQLRLAARRENVNVRRAMIVEKDDECAGSRRGGRSAS